MNSFLRFCSIVSIIIATIKLAIIGNLSQGTVIFIIMAAILILVGNRTIYIITAAVAALVLFLKVYGGGSAGAQSALLQSILTLALVCFGIFTMFRAMFPTTRRRRRYS